MKQKDYFNNFFPIRPRILHNRRDLGQNFLTNEKVLNSIVEIIPLKNRKICEIGGGVGGLTIKIMLQQPIFLEVVEKDPKYVSHLQSYFNDCPTPVENIQIILADAMTYNINTDVIMGNLPYNIASNFLINLCTNTWNEGIFMVQKEVAQRIISTSGKEYGVLSVFLQTFTKPSFKFSVGASCFFPAPKVTSAIIHLSKLTKITIFPTPNHEHAASYTLEQQKAIARDYLNFLHKGFLHRRRKYYGDLRPDQIGVSKWIELYLQAKSKRSYDESPT